MIDYVIKVVCTTAETRLTIFVQKLQNDVHELIAIINSIFAFVRENNPRLSDFQQKQAPLLIVKWSDADEHLVDEDAEGPPIDGKVVALLHDHLGGEVLGRPAERLGQVVLRQRLGQTIVDNLQVALLVQ